MTQRKLGSLALAVVTVVVSIAAATASATTNASSPGTLPTVDDASIQARFTSIGGADPLATDQTIPHWFSTYVDPNNGLTYGYNMVGVDPASNGSSTIPVDIIPLNLVFEGSGGLNMNGADVVARTIDSPIFKSIDYSTVAESTGGAGVLSAGNVGQYEDAVMRSQFNKVGSGYHLKLGTPSVLATETISIPQNQGLLALNGRGVILGRVSISWFSAQINNLMNTLRVDPTHLSIFLTNNVMLYIGKPGNCCVIGYHGAGKAPGSGTGNPNSNGNAKVQTFMFASYTTPGTFNNLKTPGSGGYWIKDIHALGHELAEWGDDPFINNAVEPWLTPTAPQYGCTGLLETGDPVVGIGFNVGTNPYDTNAFSDGAYHPEDEAFLGWFARFAPQNNPSQPEQGKMTGRYTFMGALNPFPAFRAPATGC